MNFAAAALLGLTMGQPIGQDYHAMNSRNIKLPIKYEKDPRTIRQVTLYVARNGENTWYQEGSVTPDKDAFVYVAKEDGLYWFKMQIEDLKGNKDPADLTRDPPDLKMVVDTTKPVIRVGNTKRNGEEIVVEWAVEDKFPNDDATRVQFRATSGPENAWQDVTLPSGARNGVRFPSGISGGVTVKISTADVAGNRTEVTHDFPAGNASTTTTLSSPGGGAPAPAPTGGTGNSGPLTVPPPAVEPVPPAPLPPTGAAALGGPGATPPIGPAPISAPLHTPIAPYPQPPVNPAPAPSSPPPALAGNVAPVSPVGTAPVEGTKPLPTFDPKAAPPAPTASGQSTATAVAAWTGASPPAEAPRAQVINYARFDLGFDLERRGPSGISRVDLWVTRDEGRSWQWWSKHDGKGGAIRVALDAKENPVLEGNYGFRLVPVSGAGLSDGKPSPGDAPDMRVVVDVTPPKVVLTKTEPEPGAPDTLVIKWDATDRNFGDDPITLEWSDSATGPWKPVATTGAGPVVQATALDAPAAKRLANTGQFSWKVPAGIPARVHLKITARDAAGNVTERVTVDPILVDLTTPRAKINGIVPPVAVRP